MSAIKHDRNWGPEDPMLQHQWRQSVAVPYLEDALKSEDEQYTDTGAVTSLEKNACITSSTPNRANAGGGKSEYVSYLCADSKSINL